MTERREGWRRLFFQELLPQVTSTKTLTEAASALNQYIWGRWRIQLKHDQKPEIMSPYEVQLRSAVDAGTALHCSALQACHPFCRVLVRFGLNSQMSQLMQVIKTGQASATGLSIFLVSALRAVGVPARIVGEAPRKL